MKLHLIVLSLVLVLAACNRSEPPPIPTPTGGANNPDLSNSMFLPEDEATEVIATPAEINNQPDSYQAPAADATDATEVSAEIQAVPTATQRPIAAIINGSIVYNDQFEARLAQFQQWYPAGTPDGTPLRTFTMDNLITQILLEQSAEANDITVSEATLNNAINQAIEDSGGVESYQVWLSQSGLTEESFRLQVRDELLAQAVVSFVTQDVPLSDEFIRARYIQVDDFDTAQRVQQELQAGSDFATLVDLYSVEPSKATTHGDLGFFSQGTLLVQAVEDAAFNLQPDQVSDIVVHTRNDGTQTFFLVQTLERDPNRRLTAQQYSTLLSERFENWLAEQRATATIEILVEN